MTHQREHCWLWGNCCSTASQTNGHAVLCCVVHPACAPTHTGASQDRPLLLHVWPQVLLHEHLSGDPAVRRGGLRFRQAGSSALPCPFCKVNFRLHRQHADSVWHTDNMCRALTPPHLCVSVDAPSFPPPSLPHRAVGLMLSQLQRLACRRCPRFSRLQGHRSMCLPLMLRPLLLLEPTPRHKERSATEWRAWVLENRVVVVSSVYSA